MAMDKDILKGKTIGFIGSGNLGEALIKGLIASKKVSPAKIIVADRHKERLLFIAETYNVKIFNENLEIVRLADIVILCVKPKDLRSALEEVAGDINREKLLISVAAGVTTDYIRDIIPHPASIVRAMPNTPALALEGATGLYAGGDISDPHRAFATAIFGAVGSVVEIESEVLMDVVTGLSGSGPAYIFLVIEALTDAGVKGGLSREDARKLSIQTVLGAARLARESRRPLGDLKEMVTSPGGTTIAGLAILEEHGLRTAIDKAVEGASKRARELSR